MINNIQKLFKITASLVIGSVILWSCEPDADQLGSQFFQNGAQGTETPYPVIAYNVKNNDTIRTDAARLQSATLGAFTEPQFGMQKSSYVSQARLSSYAPDFGANPVLDSAVLVLKPLYPTDSVTTTTVEDYIYPVGTVAAKKVVSTYPITKYGRTKIGGKTLLNININEVNDFLASSTDKVYSDRDVATGTLLGTKVFDGNINSVKITKDTDATTILERAVSLRIPLDTPFFQNKIITKGSTPELADAASFIRYFKGIKISVTENDGYLFNFDPNDVMINLYYKKDKVEGTTTTREDATFTLNLGSANTHFNQIKFERAGTPAAIALATPNQITGDAKIYAQGMGGPGIGIRVPAETVADIKKMYKDNKIGIISAKIRLYTDITSWNNAYTKPNYFTVRQRDLTPETGKPEYLDTFLEDMSAFAITGKYNLIKAYDLDKNPAYYDVGITKTFKDIIEAEKENHDLVLNVGIYTTDANGSLVGASYPGLGAQNFNTRSFTPNRAVFIGTDPNLATGIALNKESAQLILTYGKK